MVQIRHTTEASPRRAPGRALPWLSRRTGFWAVAFSFLALAAFCHYGEWLPFWLPGHHAEGPR